MLVYRIHDATKHELTQAQWDALAGNPKRGSLRLWVAVAAPSVAAGQKAVEVAPTVDATHATQTWSIFPKTPAELNAEANAGDAPSIKAQATIDALTASIQLDRSTLTSAQRGAQLETDVARLLKIARHLVRSLQ